MKQQPIFIHEIKQIDNHTFFVHWSDGIQQDFRLNLLQKNCPCAKCYDIEKGKSLVDVETIPEDLKAKNIKSVGRYALKIQFTSGCSTGIYSYAMLRALNHE